MGGKRPIDPSPDPAPNKAIERLFDGAADPDRRDDPSAPRGEPPVLEEPDV